MTAKYWYSNNGVVELEINYDDAQSGFHAGQCSDSIAELLTVPYIVNQFKKYTIKQMDEVLKDYDLTRPKTKYGRMSQILWLACGDITERHEFDCDDCGMDCDDTNQCDNGNSFVCNDCYELRHRA